MVGMAPPVVDPNIIGVLNEPADVIGFVGIPAPDAWALRVQVSSKANAR